MLLTVLLVIAWGVCCWAGALSELEEALPDFDCRSSARAEALFEDLLAFAASLSLFLDTGCARASGCDSEDTNRVIWDRYLEAVFRNPAFDKAIAVECPLSLLTLRMARWGACLLTESSAVPRCAWLRVRLGDAFPREGLFGLTPPQLVPVLMNTRWMHLFCSFRQRLDSVAKRNIGVLDPNDVVLNIFDCPPKDPDQLLYPEATSGIQWLQYLTALESDRANVGSWNSARWTAAPNVLENPMMKLTECCSGYTTVVIEKLLIVQEMKTERYEAFAEALVGSLHVVDAMIAEYQEQWQQKPADSLTVFMLTRWPVLDLLCYLSQKAQARRSDAQYGYQFKPYDLDFKVEEVVSLSAEAAEVESLRASPLEAHLDFLGRRRTGRVSEPFRALSAALHAALAEEGAGGGAARDATSVGAEGGGERPRRVEKLVFVTIAWGERLARYLPRAVQRMKAFGHSHRYIVFCLDDAFCDTCAQMHSHPELCVRGRLKTILNKYTVVSAIVHLGFDAVYLDFDTLLLRDPLPALLEGAEEAEIQVARDFGGQCLNTGVIHFKAHGDVAHFLVALLKWLWRHPYEFSQKAFSGFLLHEQVTTWRTPTDRVPRWRVLDPTNAFVTSVVYNRGVEGWTGNLEDIVIYHFLDGTGGVDAGKAEAGRYVNLYDLFYANPSLDLGNPEDPLWEQDPEVKRHLLSTRLPEPPSSLQPCALLPLEDERPKRLKPAQ